MVNTLGTPHPEVIRALEIAAGACLKEEPDSAGCPVLLSDRCRPQSPEHESPQVEGCQLY